jgi:DNA-binding NarL/FixJ family response regulator
MHKSIQILIADDHRLFADGLKFILSFSVEYASVDTVEDGEAVLQYLQQKATDVVLLDIHLPGMSGIDVARHIRQHHPQVRILAVSMAEDRETVQAMIEAGAQGYCLKTAGQAELLRALDKVSKNELYFSPEIVPILLKQRPSEKLNAFIEKLTAREIELIKWLIQGHSAAEIAKKLFISPYTVETHRKNIYAKLNVHSLNELITFAQQHNLA